MSVLIKEWEVGSLQRASASAPSRSMPSGSNFPTIALNFDPAADESVYAFGEMPESDIYTASGNVIVEISWLTDELTTGTVRWKADILGRADGEAWDVAFSDSDTVDDPRTAGDALHVAIITIAAPSLSPGDRFVLKLTREGTHANDTYNGADADMIGAKLLVA